MKSDKTTAAPLELPAFPTSDLPPDEILRRLVEWSGGTVTAIGSLLCTLEGDFDAAEITDEQGDHCKALVEDLERWVSKQGTREAGRDKAFDGALAAACARYGYDHRVSKRDAKVRREVDAERKAK